MKKLPYFPFYYLDWLSSSSVSMMTHEEKGLFIDMLCRCYNDGGLIDDKNKLQRLFNCDLTALETVLEMFYPVDGLLKNKKLEKIICDQKKLIQSKSQAGKASAKARADKKLQSATGVEHVLKSVATEVQRNSTNKTEQNRTEQSKIKSRFAPPTQEEVASYCLERNNGVDSVKWFNFYSAKGWMIGKTKMKDWKAAVRTWEENKTTTKKSTFNPKTWTGR